MAPNRKGASLSGATYQVFLSFRGPDTRLGFADVLYYALTDAGIRVFRDNEEIRKGEHIGDEILMAIGESRIFVSIFSRGYASSKWCLIELSKMFESKEASPDSNKKILPIFYNVDADDVKLKTQLYADPLLKHREKFSPDTVNQWEEALRKAGKIKGYDAKNRGYGEFAKSFVREVSMKLKGKVNVEMLRLCKDEYKAWDWIIYDWYLEEIDSVKGKELSGLGKLRYLQCIGLDLSDILSNIRRLSWQCCPEKLMGTGLSFKKFVILDLSHSCITEDRNGWSQIGVGNNLKVLDLTCCEELTKTPDFSRYSSLERLILEKCINLVEIDPSIGKLKGLKFLNVNHCVSLKGLPEELCSLHYLEVILGFTHHTIYDRHLFEGDDPKVGFSNLPDSIGDLKSLLILVFHANKITRLPESIIRLSKLRHISLKGIVELHPGVGLLENLEIMELISCECMEKLPDSVGDMKSLLELKVSQSGITEIPETIGNLEQIRVISLSRSKIHMLPTSIGKLKRLEKFIVDPCNSLTEIPSTIKGCTSLRVLNLAYCGSMKELPDSIWDLSLLTELDLPFSGITELPETIGNLKELRLINIKGCKISKLLTVIGMLKKLEVLNASKCFLREIPSTIHGCTSLRELNLSYCESLKELPDLVGDLRSLHKLDLSYSGITKLPETIGNLKELRELSVMGCGLLKEIPSTINGCTQLTELYFRGCENIQELENLHKVFEKLQVSSDSDWDEVSSDSD